MAAQLPVTVGSPVGSADQSPRLSVWYRYPSPGPLGIPGEWQTTSRWTVEDLLDEGFEVYSPELTQKLFPPATLEVVSVSDQSAFIIKE